VGTVSVVGKSLAVSTTTTTTFASGTDAIVANRAFVGTGNLTISNIATTGGTSYTGKWSFFVGKSASPEAKFTSTSIAAMELNAATGAIFVRGIGNYASKGQPTLSDQQFCFWAVAKATGLDQFRARISSNPGTTLCGDGVRRYDNDPGASVVNPTPPNILKGNISIKAN
jgi:hypothetical protein